MLFNVGECTKTGADERLYNQTPSVSWLSVTPNLLRKLFYISIIYQWIEMNKPKPILSRAFITDSGGNFCLCSANVFRHIPSPRNWSQNIFIEEFSTGKRPPTRCANSQYANSHQLDDNKDESVKY